MNADAQETQHALALRPGVLLADQFRLVRSLRGTSSFAFSYHAEDLTTGDEVVIKEFFPRSLVSRGTDGLTVRPHSGECERDFLRALHRFALEGAVLAESSHPNLVRARAVIDANATVYLVMDRQETQPLAEYVQNAGGRIPSAEAGRLAQHLLSALQVLHTESIIHRDLSPRSVHVGANGSAMLLEFSARRHLPMHATDLASGFAAFEQYGMRDIGPWTDVYAVSALLYYMLTGNTPPSALERAAGETLVSPLTGATGVAPGLARVVVKGMALLPQQRPHAVSELRRQLESALAESTSASARNAANAAPPEMSAADLTTAMNDGAPDDYDRNVPLRLAAGGIVVPGEERGVRLLRMLGSAATRFRRSMTPAPSPFASPELTEPTFVDPRPSLRFAEPARAPVVELAAPATAPVLATPNATKSRVAEDDEADRASALAAELAFATDAMQASVERDEARRRYGFAAAAGLVLLVGGSLVLLARNGRASGVRTPEPSFTPPTASVTPAVTQTPSDAHVSVDAGAVLQSAPRLGSAASRSQTDSPTQSTKRTVTQTRSATPTPAPSAPASSRERVLPPTQLPNVKVALSGNNAPDLRIVPLGLLVDPRTRLTNGQDQVEQGEYVTARRTFRMAIAQLDSAATKYPDSQAIRNLKQQLEQADAGAVQACTAENDMRKRRGEQARACQ